MAITLLEAVNRSLKRARVITGDITSFTDGQYQSGIDNMIQYWQEAVRDVLRYDAEMPVESAVDNIVLVESVREYCLPSDLEQINWPLHNEVDGRFIYHYRGGFEQMRRDQRQPDNFNGTPFFATVSPETGDLRMDRIPDAQAAGEVFKIHFDRRITLNNESCTFPFSDSAAEELIPAIAETFKLDFDQRGSSAIYQRAIGRSIGLITKRQPRTQRHIGDRGTPRGLGRSHNFRHHGF